MIRFASASASSLANAIGGTTCTSTGCVSAPIVDYGDGRGNTPWGFGSGVPGPESGYAWYFDWDEYVSLGAVPATDMQPAMSDDEIGPWKRIQEAAEEAYDRSSACRFTAFVGFEWTGMPNGDNLHRVVMFADGADKTGQVLPYGTFDSADPEDLWKYLAAYEANTGGTVIAVPHNGNLSNGIMFGTKTFSGEAITRAYAEERMRWAGKKPPRNRNCQICSVRKGFSPIRMSRKFSMAPMTAFSRPVMPASPTP